MPERFKSDDVLDSIVGDMRAPQKRKPLSYIPQENALDNAVTDINASKNAQLNNSYNVALVDDNPDHEAEVKRLSEALTLPPDAVRQNFDEINRRYKEDQFKEQELLKKYPHTSKFMSVGDNARLVTDDIPSLKEFESMVSPVTRPGLAKRLVTGGAGSFVAGIGPRFAQGVYGAGETAMLLADQFVGETFKEFTGGLELPFGDIATGLGNLRGRAKAVDEMLSPDMTGAGRLEKAFYNAAGSVGQQIPGIGMTLMTRNPKWALGTMGVTVGGQESGRALDEGVEPVRAAVFGATQGLTEVAFEAAPIFRLMGDLKAGSSLGKTLITQLLVEVPSEIATTIVQDFNEWALLHPEKPFSGYLAQLPSNILDTVLSTAMSVGMQTSMVHTVDRYANGKTEADRVKNQGELIDKMNKLAVASKLRERSPASFEQFVKEAAEEGPMPDVYIDSETLMQSGVDLEGMSDEVKEQIPVGNNIGTQVRIPIEEYTTLISGQEGSQALLEHLKVNPHDMSRAEAKDFMETEGEELKAEVARVLDDRAEDDLFIESKQLVEDKIFEQAETAARFTSDVNRTQAQIASSTYAVWADRLGLTPEAMYEKYPISLKATESAGFAYGEETAEPTELFQQRIPKATIERDERGFYSKAASEVSGMDLPTWKAEKGVALTADEDVRYDELKSLFRQETGKLTDEQWQEWEDLKERKVAGGAASGKEVWKRISQNKRIKKDELNWLGLEEFLQTKEKFTRQEVMDFINQEGVKVKEDVAIAGEREDMEDRLSWGTGEVYDESDPENPIYIYRDSAADMEITGNDEQGFTIRSPDGYEIGTASSLNEAYIEAEAFAQDHGLIAGADEGFAKWEEYVHPGTYTNYREMKGLLPGVEGEFVEGAHFDEPNILFFLRVTDRKISGDNTFFIDEFQSDWHQQGRVRGYESATQAERDDRKAAAQKKLDVATEKRKVITQDSVARLEKAIGSGKLKPPYQDEHGMWVTPGVYGASVNRKLAMAAYATDRNEEVKQANQAMFDAMASVDILQFDIPDAPFGDDAWIGLGVKRAILAAVEGGYDRIAWSDAATVSDRWSERYSEAYKNQYDKKMPGLFKKLTGSKPKHEGDHWEMEITDELKDKVIEEGFALFQDKRGAYTPSTRTITQLENADLSTFFHEFGHFMLETQYDIAAQANAPQEIRDDMDAMFKWFGVRGRTPEERMEKWGSMTLEEKRDSHEKFARGFEKYLFTGKAPSAELRHVFQRIRSWMVSVYEKLKNLNVSLTPEVTQVFDRMLATDTQIKEAEFLAKYEPLFREAQAAGMDTDAFVEYLNLDSEATEEAITNLDSRNLRDMQWLSGARSRELRKLQARANAKRKRVREEITEEVMDEQVYQTMEYLKRGTIGGEPVVGETHKLSTVAVKEMMGADLYADLVGWHGKYGMLAKDGAHPDAVAELFGYTSGDHMLHELLGAENMKEKIDALTDQRMLEQYGELVDPEAMEAAVMTSLKNDTRAKFLAAEVAALNKATGGRRFLAKAAKQFAEDMVNRQRIRDVRPAQYEAAEAKAGGKAKRAADKGDLETAALNKRNQLINLYAGKGARKALEDVDKGVNYVRKFIKGPRKGAKKLPAEYLDQILALLENFDMAKASNKNIDRRVNLRAWVEKLEEQGITPDIPQELLDNVQRKSYKEMTVEEFRGLIDTIKQIEHIGKLKNTLLTAKKQADFNIAKNEIVEAIKASAPAKPKNVEDVSNKGGRLGQLHESFHAIHRKMASLMQQMDGKEGGPMWEYIVRGMNEAADRETTMREDANIKLTGIVQGILNAGDVGGKGDYFPGLATETHPQGVSLNREQRIAIVLNHGNAGNTQRLLDGEGWTEEQFQIVLDTLTEDDVNFIQEVWDYFEGYRPEIAEKERRVLGREPDWVEPVALETKFGTLRGGYYPIKYNTKRSGASQAQDEAQIAKQMIQGAFTAATTRRSFTKSRAKKVTGRPLLYSFQTIFQGTEEIIHDLTHQEWLIDTNKFLRSKDVDDAIRLHYGPDYMNVITSGVKDVAAGNEPAQNVLETSLNHIRVGATVAGLAWNTLVSLLQPLGLTNSMVRIGPKWVAKGLMYWLKNPVTMVEELYAKNEFMRLRAKTFQRELNEVENSLKQPGLVRKAAGKLVGADKARKAEEWADWSYFIMIQKLQAVADLPTYFGAYEKQIAKGETDERAMALANQAVIDAQGTGLMKDLSQVQRGGAGQKLFTNFYSFFNVQYNLNADIKGRTDWKNPASVAVAAAEYAMIIVVPSVLAVLLKEAVTHGDEDWDAEELVRKLTAEQISFLLGMMVGVRELSSGVQKVAGVSNYTSAYSGPAGLRFFQEAGKFADQVSQGEADRAFRRSLVGLTGVVAHAPASAVNRTLDGLVEFSEGNAGAKALLVGPPRR